MEITFNGSVLVASVSELDRKGYRDLSVHDGDRLVCSLSFGAGAFADPGAEQGHVDRLLALVEGDEHWDAIASHAGDLIALVMVAAPAEALAPAKEKKSAKGKK